MKQFGTVLVFKPSATINEVNEALESLEKVLQSSAGVRMFNPEHGGPVWYIP